MSNRRLNWKRDTRDHQDLIYDPKLHNPQQSICLPLEVDLTYFMPPIEDQGAVGSCTAHAYAAAIEFLERKAGNSQSGNDGQRASRLFIYYNERMIEGTVDKDSGAQLRDGAKALSQYGVCNETVWPYDPNQLFTHPSVEAYNEAAARKIQKYIRVTNNYHMRHCLASGFPVAIGIEVYSSFESEAVARTGIVPMPQANEEYLGGHAVLVVGYDEIAKVFTVRNSWGTNWGRKGYCYLPFAYLDNPNLAADFWTIQK